MQKRSSKFNVQLISEAFIQFGLKDIVISPGSRNGGLTMQFVNEASFNCYSIVDERSAAFVGLGMAQKTGKPVVICCTSGSAAANYYPAITEAFYQNVPLVVLTADRPEKFTDLFDGQTIRQQGLYDKHIYKSVQLTEDDDDANLTDNFLKIKETLIACVQNSGPVHINMPFSEPLYESTEEKLIDFDKLSVPKNPVVTVDWETLDPEYRNADKVMVLVGQQNPDDAFNALIGKLTERENVIILTETTSNLHHSNLISQIDAALRNIDENNAEKFQPDLLITLGQNVISKKIKQFLRQYKPKYHWHVDRYWHPDTYFCLTQKINFEAKDFVQEFLEKTLEKSSVYRNLWLDIKERNDVQQAEFMKTVAWSDLRVFKNIVENFPGSAAIHYSNSAVIRYSQLFRHDPTNEVYCNRGTSGIDGSTSTAAGFAMKSEKQVILVTGDISFFYDSNGLWNNYLPANFRIILVNNGGGNIFSIIPGPDSTGALDKFFETKHDFTAEHLSKIFNFDYLTWSDASESKNIWKKFYEMSERPKILEINTKSAPNAQTLRQFIDIKNVE